MKISTKGRYALRMMLDIAENQAAGYVTLRDIAERQAVSKKYLEQIALQLTQCGALKAVRGHQGGYKLVRSPGEYTVGALLRVMEGSLAPVACLEQRPNLCERCEFCETLPVWEELDRRINEYLDGITLQDVMDQAAARRQAKGDLPPTRP